MHGLPVFFFDSGHSARLSKPFHETCLAHYYFAAPPILLDVEERLNAIRLAELSKGFLVSAQEFCRELTLLPTPTEMVDGIFNDA